MIKKVLMSLLGMVVALTWWTIKGDGRHHELMHSIPAKAWDGGGGTIAVTVNTTAAGKMSIGFEEPQEKGRDLHTEEQAGPGSHSWSVEVPRNVGGYIEFEADAPKIGDRMSWTITHDGRRIAAESITMERPLQKGEAFFLVEYYDDFSRVRGVEVASSDDDDGDDE